MNVATILHQNFLKSVMKINLLLFYSLPKLHFLENKSQLKSNYIFGHGMNVATILHQKFFTIGDENKSTTFLQSPQNFIFSKTISRRSSPIIYLDTE